MGRGKSATSTSDSGERSDDVNAEVVMRPSFLGKLGQSMNVAGISLFLKLAVSDASLAVPHIDCESIQDIDWFKLKKAGFTAVIFDKDNTLTIPYATEVHPPLQESMKECKQAFGNERVCVYSNSAGLEQYDPDGIEATHLERELGIRVARHKEKKPSGSGAELAKFLNSNSNNSSNEKEKSSKKRVKDSKPTNPKPKKEKKKAIEKVYPVPAEGYKILDPSMSLVTSDMKRRATPYLCFTFQQYHGCNLNTGGANPSKNNIYKSMPDGFPGLECVHCKERRFFYRDTETYKANYAHISEHILKCSHCPASIKEELATKKTEHLNLQKKMPKGFQRQFFDSLCARLGKKQDEE